MFHNFYVYKNSQKPLNLFNWHLAKGQIKLKADWSVIVTSKKWIPLFCLWENLRHVNQLQSAYRFIWPLSPKHFIGNSCVYFFFVPNLVATREFEKNCSNQILQASADPGTREKFVLYKQKTSLLSSLWHRWSCMSLCCQNGGNYEH